MIKLSIVTVYKFGKFSELEITVASVRRQTVIPFQHIIVVSGVKDGDGKIKLLENEYTSLFINQDCSLYNAMNIGLGVAIGDAVIFLNGGDEFYDCNSIEKINSRYQPGRCLAMRSAQYYKNDIYIRPSAKRLKDLYKFPSHQAFVAPLPAGMRFLFDESRIISADYYWMKDLSEYHGLDIDDAVLVMFALGGISNYPTLKSVRLRFAESGIYRSALEVLKLFARLLFGNRRYYNILLSRKCFRVHRKSS